MSVSKNSDYAEVGMVPTCGVMQKENDAGADQGQLSLEARTTALLDGLTLVLEHHQVGMKIISSLHAQLHSHLDNLSSEKIWLEQVKYLLSYPLAKYLRNEPPTAPCNYFRPSGPLRSFMRSRLLNYNPKNTHLWTSWLQAKRSCLAVSESQILSSYMDHEKLLTSPDSGDDNLIDRIMENPTFAGHLDQLAESVLQGFTKFTDFTKKHPSLSACYEANRGNCGSYGGLGLLFPSNFSGSPENLWLYHPEMVSMQEIHCTYGKPLRYNQVVTIRAIAPDDQDEWNETIKDAFLSRSIKTLFGCPKTQMDVMIQGIVEPNKVRVISKGNAVPYYAAKPIQKVLHSSMRVLPAYRLIGRPLCPTDLNDLERIDPNYEWFSIDYKNATDNLSWKYSSRILSHVVKHLPSAWQDLAMDVLGPAHLHYPKPSEEVAYDSEILKKYETFLARVKLTDPVMRRGQLMGSVLSFPILCLANMGLYLEVMRHTHDEHNWSNKKRLDNVLINGDDQLYLAPPELWQDHIEKGRKIGLEMSIGKAYHHPSYANVNSTSIDLRAYGTPRQINFLNSGLFYGKKKVMAHTDRESTVTENCSLVNKLMNGSLPGRQVSLMKRWIHYHREELKLEQISIRGNRTHYRNLFLPLELGGMGVIPPAGFKFFVTHQDCVVATSLFNKLGSTSTQLPLPGYAPSSLNSYLELPHIKWASFFSNDTVRVPNGRIAILRSKRCRLPAIPWSLTPSVQVV